MDIKIWEAQIVDRALQAEDNWKLWQRTLHLFYLFLKILLMWTTFKVFVEYVTILFLFFFFFTFWFTDCEACGILVPWPGIKLTPFVLEGKVSTTGPAGKSLHLCSLVVSKSMNQTLSRRKTHQGIKVRNISNGGDWISSQEGVAVLVYKCYLYPYL